MLPEEVMHIPNYILKKKERNFCQNASIHSAKINQKKKSQYALQKKT